MAKTLPGTTIAVDWNRPEEAVKACPVLGGGQGVKALQLGQHPCPGGKPLQPKQGGVPDQLGQCICNLHR